MDAVESVKNQDFSDYELIIVDDCSTDGTDNLVQSELKPSNNGNIKYVRHRVNRGGAAARNTGILNSCGKYVAFLDDDDIWNEKKLSKQIELIENHDESYGLVITSYKLVGENGNIKNRPSIPDKSNYTKEILQRNMPLTASAILIEREIAEMLGGFDTDFDRLQDAEFLLRALELTHMLTIDQPLVSTGEWNLPSPSKMEYIEKLYMSKFDETIKKEFDDPEIVYANHSLLMAELYLREKKVAKAMTYASGSVFALGIRRVVNKLTLERTLQIIKEKYDIFIN